MGHDIDYSKLPNWKLIEIAARELTMKKPEGVFTREELINYINNVLLKGYKPRNPSSLNPMIQAVTANVPGGAPGGIGKNILYRVGRGLYRLFDPEKDEVIPEKAVGYKMTAAPKELIELNIVSEIPVSRVDSSWRIVIPESIREYMKLKPGDYVAFTRVNNMIVLRKARLKIELE